MSRIKLALPKVASRPRLVLLLLRHARAPRGRCLAGSGRWQTPSDQRQLFARTCRCQHDCRGVAESVAPHALIHLQNIGELWLIDFGSSNETFLNKRRIHHPIRLTDGDQITNWRRRVDGRRKFDGRRSNFDFPPGETRWFARRPARTDSSGAN
jgi:hypothetical protein